jgi:hypothetical protein
MHYLRQYPTSFFLFFLLISTSCKTRSIPPVFQAETIDHQVEIGYGIAIGDVNGDQKPDILLADKKQFVWYRNPDWTRFVMVDSISERDNVCIAARDLDGDGKVEVAVGAQWNPGETTDSSLSGSVHFLIPPKDPTDLWTTKQLYHEPTVHRMKWVLAASGDYYLTVLPLHGIGNQQGEGTPVNLITFKYPDQPEGVWDKQILSTGMHLTHNYDVQPAEDGEYMIIGGKEGIRSVLFDGDSWALQQESLIDGYGYGEVRMGYLKNGYPFIAGVEPLHGNILSVFHAQAEETKEIITHNLNQGHALACADLLSRNEDQMIIGWRTPNTDQQMGIQLFTREQYGKWESHWIDKNEMACEDLKVADLNGDGHLDIIASGRSTHNLKIYWNRSFD